MVQILAKSDLKVRGFPNEDTAKNGLGVTLITLPATSGLVDAVTHPQVKKFMGYCVDISQVEKEIKDLHKKQEDLQAQLKENEYHFPILRPTTAMAAITGCGEAMIIAICKEFGGEPLNTFYLFGAVAAGALVGGAIEIYDARVLNSELKRLRTTVSSNYEHINRTYTAFFKSFSDCDIR